MEWLLQLTEHNSKVLFICRRIGLRCLDSKWMPRYIDWLFTWQFVSRCSLKVSWFRYYYNKEFQYATSIDYIIPQITPSPPELELRMERLPSRWGSCSHKRLCRRWTIFDLKIYGWLVSFVTILIYLWIRKYKKAWTGRLICNLTGTYLAVNM